MAKGNSRTNDSQYEGALPSYSRLKRELKESDDPPPDEYLNRITLAKTEYNTIQYNKEQGRGFQRRQNDNKHR